MNFINPRKLIKMARKWQKLAASKPKTISFPRAKQGVDHCSSSTMPEKGHFVVYSCDQRRFVIPLLYLENKIIIELFRVAEDEFGVGIDGPIVLPFEAVFVEYIISLIQRSAAKDIERALLISINSTRCSSFPNLDQEQSNQQPPICGF